jgi:hypothetical protein
MAPKKLHIPDSAPLGFLRFETASERLAAGDAAGAAEVAQSILRSARSRTPVFRLDLVLLLLLTKTTKMMMMMMMMSARGVRVSRSARTAVSEECNNRTVEDLR